MPLQRLNWSQRNYDALNEFLAGVRPGELAVFDWDNTCIFGDIGEALFRHAALNLAFKFDAATLETMIPDSVNGVASVIINQKPFPLDKMKEAIVASYGELEAKTSHGGRIGFGDNYRIFTSGLLALNKSLEETPGIGCEFAYPWVNGFLQGLTLTEFEQMATTVIDQELRNPIRRHIRNDPRRRWRYEWTGGVRLYQEMKDLAAAWEDRGGAVVISTASNRQLVEKMIAMTAFHCRRVIGMGPATAGNRFGLVLELGLRPNLGTGKVANIRNLLKNEPVLVAGDSRNDYEMLSSFPSTRMRLIVNRHAGGKIALLCRRALAGEKGYLAQEINPQQGEFKPENNLI
ncbi:MAG TPA: haloacid dehalogenase-like hydrolase [Patescibacteria group bacterium]|nr:haloacid dehalogenase-like hydrolase [Patescibacteria group bacterium]